MLSRSKSETAHRKCKERRRPEIIHIRKPSLSNSVSSAESTSTTSTFRSAHSSPNRPTHAIDFDPLNLHPTFVPPPRLSERPFIFAQADHPARYEYSGAEDDVLEHYFHAQDCKTDSMPSPPTDSPTPMQQLRETPTGHDRPDEGGDYFLYKLRLVEHQERQKQAAVDAMAVPQSRWSMSTVDVDVDESAIGDDTDGTDDTEEYDDDEEPVLEMAIRVERPARHAASWQNFSYKRDPLLAPASPRRPPMKTMDSVEDFIKRGGWKRRGIVFEGQPDEARTESSMF